MAKVASSCNCTTTSLSIRHHGMGVYKGGGRRMGGFTSALLYMVQMLKLEYPDLKNKTTFALLKTDRYVLK